MSITYIKGLAVKAQNGCIVNKRQLLLLKFSSWSGCKSDLPKQAPGSLGLFGLSVYPGQSLPRMHLPVVEWVGFSICCCCWVASVVSDFVWPHRRQHTRLPCPWDFPGKNTGVGCHFLLQSMKVKSENEVGQSCLTLCDPMDCSLPGSSTRGIFQAGVLEWVALYTHPNTRLL